MLTRVLKESVENYTSVVDVLLTRKESGHPQVPREKTAINNQVTRRGNFR